MRIKTGFNFKWIIFVVLALPAVLFVWACGGGGGDNASGPDGDTRTPAAINQRNVEAAFTMAGNSIDTAADVQSFGDDNLQNRASGDPASQHSKALGTWALNRVRDAFIAGDIVKEGEMVRTGSVSSGSQACQDSGTYSIVGTWTGPDDTDDKCQVSDFNLTFLYSNCVEEAGETIDGSMAIAISGPLCEPTSVSIGVSDFTLHQVNGEIMESTAFDLTIIKSQGDGAAPTEHYTMVLHGDMTTENNSMDFDQFTIDVSDDGSVETVAFNGSLTGGCMDGWVTLTTISPVVKHENDDCPTGGSIEISGAQDASILVTYNDDGSVDIGEQHYDSCQDQEEAMPDQCK